MWALQLPHTTNLCGDVCMAGGANSRCGSAWHVGSLFSVEGLNLSIIIM